MKEINLVNNIRELQNNHVATLVGKRIREFAALYKKPSGYWFSELCFCILTANSRAASAIDIQAELGVEGFKKCGLDEVRQCIRKHKHRFHNNKSECIVLARDLPDVKNKVKQHVNISGEKGARNWLAENVKGIGYKEASHFMRNVGYKNLAILDRHILNLLVENRFMESKPKTISRKVYESTEQKLKQLAESLELNLAELDLYMWYIKTGEILK